MSNTVLITVNGKVVTAQKGEKVISYLGIESPCGGHGKCGKCKIKAIGSLSSISESEFSVLSKEEIEQGIRLACCTEIKGYCEIETFVCETKEKIISDGLCCSNIIEPMFKNYGLAVDIGTTTIAAKLYDISGTVLSEAVEINPQIKWGADVISRIEASLNGNSVFLQKAVVDSIDRMVFDMAKKSAINTYDINGMVMTGNTAMLYFLTNTSVEDIAKAPFKVKRQFNEKIYAKDIGLTSVLPETEIFLPPCISAFVGADIVCDLLATEFCDGHKTKLLVDIGTNGEMCLWYNGKLFVSSTAAGPAFEGVGISCGMRAKTGAIDKAFINNNQLAVHIIGSDFASGICGSGLIDVIALLLELGIIDETGLIKEKVRVCDSVYITPQDVRMVQMTKSAISAGIKTLMDVADVKRTDITELAGGFGSYLDVKNAVRIGLLPHSVVEKVSVVGNAALSGASAILLNKWILQRSQHIVANATTVELASNPIFSEHYMMDMMF